MSLTSGEPTIAGLELCIKNMYQQRRFYRKAVIETNDRIRAINDHILEEQDLCRVDGWGKLLRQNEEIAANLDRHLALSGETLSLFTGIWERLSKPAGANAADDNILNPKCIGQSFQLAEETDLKPDLYSKFSVDGFFLKIEKLPAGTRIKILDIKIIKFIIHYHVQVGGLSLQGWISSFELIGMEINRTNRTGKD